VGKKTRVVVFRNSETGETVAIDSEGARLRRMRKRVFAWSRVAPGGCWYILVTLTYAPGCEPRARDVSEFMRRVRRHLGEHLLGYCWVAEVQRRGALHYHVVLAVDGPGVKIPKPDVAGWWVHGMTRVERARSPVGYLASYVKKNNQKSGLPSGFRMFAVVWRLAAGVAKFVLAVVSLPAWVLAQVSVDEIFAAGVVPRRAPGGGWRWLERVLRSPWVFVESFLVPCGDL
jgi:hypothetical protein